MLSFVDEQFVECDVDTFLCAKVIFRIMIKYGGGIMATHSERNCIQFARSRLMQVNG